MANTKMLLAVAPIGVVVALLGGTATGSAATVLTLEGGLVGLQHIVHFVPGHLQGALCKAPNTCQPVDYVAWPNGAQTQAAGQLVTERIGQTPGQVVLFGHSQGGQVIYSALRDWAADPATAPDPARVTWVSTGNLENKYGGAGGGVGYTNGEGLPDNTPYPGTEVIRQYDGWADAPDDKSNLLAVLNAEIGKQTLHTNYRDIDLTDEKNVRLVEGNVTYVWVPTDTLPLIAWAGPFAPALDNALRPIVERAYHRPVTIPDPTPPATATKSAGRLAERQAARDSGV